MFSSIKKSVAYATSAFSKVSSSFSKKLTSLFKGTLSEEKIEEIESLLYQADIGSSIVCDIIDEISSKLSKNANTPNSEYIAFIKHHITSIMRNSEYQDTPPVGLCIDFFIGVNGAGKTTTSAKYANILKKKGRNVALAACDTFRAGAIKQLEILGKRIGIDVIKKESDADPSSVVYEAVSFVLKNEITSLVIDTAGRLESKESLLRQLTKMHAVSKKLAPLATIRSHIVLDATTGQGALLQAEIFSKAVPIDSLIITKLDTSSKAGSLLAIYKSLSIPISYIGTGEKTEDMIPFSALDYTNALFEFSDIPSQEESTRE